LAPALSPAFTRIGPYVEFAPATVLTLWAAFQYVQYFGTFNLVQSFASPTADYSDPELARLAASRGDPRANYGAGGTELTLGMDLQFKISSIVVRSRGRLVRPDMNLRDGDRTHYDQFYDVLAPNRGWFLTNDFDVLYQGLERKLIAGLRYTATLPFYGQRHFAPGETPVAANDLHRVGPLVGWTFFSQDGAKLNNPTVFVLAQWWIQHRFRAGQQVSRAVPLFGVGFQTTGDLLPAD
ncbi:MAG: hypothetical protein ACK4N5_07745, partial [Myxococcales bacterium]